MARTIKTETEDALDRLFNHTQDIQRRIVRIISRNRVGQHALNELRTQLQGMMAELDFLEKDLSSQD